MRGMKHTERILMCGMKHTDVWSILNAYWCTEWSMETRAEVVESETKLPEREPTLLEFFFDKKEDSLSRCGSKRNNTSIKRAHGALNILNERGQCEQMLLRVGKYVFTIFCAFLLHVLRQPTKRWFQAEMKIFTNGDACQLPTPHGLCTMRFEAKENISVSALTRPANIFLASCALS